ncbi:MAG TPA: hypothetical protein VHC63_10180 [Acidimicrobiales bacterium]|nr:hypothetical protein [Acidimicrobiales bacterium]
MVAVQRPASSPTGAGTVGTAASTAVDTETRTQTVSRLADDVAVGRMESEMILRSSRDLVQRWDQLHVDTATILHRQATAHRMKQPMVDLLAEISDLGFPWSEFARVVGVSVPALRKWRLGADASPENHTRVAEVVAFCDVLADRHPGIADIVGWLSMPLVAGSRCPVTGMDLLSERRLDLLFRHAEPNNDPHTTLDLHDPDWRSRYDDPFEVVVADDGLPSVRMRHDR